MSNIKEGRQQLETCFQYKDCRSHHNNDIHVRNQNIGRHRMQSHLDRSGLKNQTTIWERLIKWQSPYAGYGRHFEAFWRTVNKESNRSNHCKKQQENHGMDQRRNCNRRNSAIRSQDQQQYYGSDWCPEDQQYYNTKLQHDSSLIGRTRDKIRHSILYCHNCYKQIRREPIESWGMATADMTIIWDCRGCYQGRKNHPQDHIQWSYISTTYIHELDHLLYRFIPDL